MWLSKVEIKDDSSRTIRRFDNLCPGDFFIFDEKLCVRTHVSDIAFCFNDREPISVSNGQVIDVVDCKITYSPAVL